MHAMHICTALLMVSCLMAVINQCVSKSDTCSVTMNENITVFVHKKTPQAFVVNKCHSKSKREFEILNVRYKPHQTFANDLLVV